MNRTAGVLTEHPGEGASDATALVPLLSGAHARSLDRLNDAGDGVSSESFFDAMMGVIIDVLEPTLLFVGALQPPGDRARTLVTYTDGHRTDNFEYRLAHTPCSEVLVPRGICIYTEEVADLFPRNVQLRTMHAQGYVGMHLKSRSGIQIGIIAAITTHPLTDIAEVRATYYGFRCRLALELERMLVTAAEEDTAEVDRAIEAEERLLRAAVGAEA